MNMEKDMDQSITTDMNMNMTRDMDMGMDMNMGMDTDTWHGHGHRKYMKVYKSFNPLLWQHTKQQSKEKIVTILDSNFRIC